MLLIVVLQSITRRSRGSFPAFSAFPERLSLLLSPGCNITNQVCTRAEQDNGKARAMANAQAISLSPRCGTAKRRLDICTSEPKALD
jgi:hypothetical protein